MAEAAVGMLRVVLASDTAQFQAGMDKAAGALSGFERTTKSAAASLSRMVSDFNGNKIAAEAQKVASAVEKVGGASKLTDVELGRVNRTLDAAIQKYALMGQEVPPHIAKLSAEVKALDGATAKAAAPSGGLGSFSTALGMVGRLLPGLSVAGAITTLTGMATAALKASDEIVKFSARTGASIDTVQRWRYVADQTSTSVDAFANNAFKLGINVATGTDKVRAAIGELGLAYSTLKSMKPEDQFNTVVKALEGVESATERNRLGQQLFGRQFAEIAVAVAEGYTKMKNEAVVASEAQVRAAEAAGDAIDRFKAKVAAISLKVFGDLAMEVMDTAASLDSLNEAEMQAFTVAQRLGEGHLYLVKLQRERLAGQKDITLATEAATATQASYTAQLAAVRAEVAALTPAQKEQINAALQLGGVTEELSTNLGVSEEALRMYASQLSAAAKAAKETGQGLSFIDGELTPLTQLMIQGTIPAFSEFVTETGHADRVMAELSVEIARMRGELITIGPILKNTFKPDLFVPFKAAVQDSGAETRSFFGKWKDEMSAAGMSASSLSNLFAQAFTGGGGALGAIKAFATQGLNAMLGMIPGVGVWAQAFAGPIVAMLSKLTRRFGDFFRNLFGGPSAQEMEQRGQVAEFEDSLHSALTTAQEAESQGEDWRRTVIAIRDAYIAMGRTEEEALRDAERLWQSSRDGGEDALAVIEEIKRKMRELTSGEHTIEVDVEYRTSAPPGAERPGEPENHTQPVDPGFATGTMGRFGNWFRDFRKGFPTTLHNVEAVVPKHQALAFAQDVMGAAGASGGGVAVLPVIMGSDRSPREIAADAVNHLAKSGLPTNESGIASAIEAVIDNWFLTYARG